MKVACPYTTLHPLVDQALRNFAPDAERYQLGRHADAYYAYFLAIWAQGEGFLNVEHDVEIYPEVIPQLEACPEDWCVFPYMGGLTPGSPGDGHIYGGLGCTRFSTKLIQANPTLIQTLPVRNWQNLDSHILPALLGLGYERHYHEPPVLHHHIYSQGKNSWCACGHATHLMPEAVYP